MKLLRMSCVFMVLIASAVNASSVSEKLEKELEELNSNCKGFQGLLSEFKDDPSGRCIKGERAEDYSDAKPSRPISLSNPEKASSGSGRGSDTGSDTNNSNSQRNNAAQPDKQAGGEQRYQEPDYQPKNYPSWQKNRTRDYGPSNNVTLVYNSPYQYAVACYGKKAIVNARSILAGSNPKNSVKQFKVAIRTIIEARCKQQSASFALWYAEIENDIVSLVKKWTEEEYQSCSNKYNEGSVVCQRYSEIISLL